jgi:ubiquinone/menaquinone biosynthesis C-methylase UbiE
MYRVAVPDEQRGSYASLQHAFAGEHDRLHHQADHFAAATASFLASAGLTAGMRVIDVGTGQGDVALLAGRIVGPSGSVLGIDADGAALDEARARAAAERLTHVSFVQASLEEFAPTEPADAVVGRFVMIHQRDPTAALRRVAAWVRPGGLVAFQETEFLDTVFVAGPAHRAESARRMAALAREVRERAGMTSCGLDLYLRMREAGLEPDPTVSLGVPFPVVRRRGVPGSELGDEAHQTLVALARRFKLRGDAELDAMEQAALASDEPFILLAALVVGTSARRAAG